MIDKMTEEQARQAYERRMIESVGHYAEAVGLLRKLTAELGDTDALTVLCAAAAAGFVKWGLRNGLTESDIENRLVWNILSGFEAISGYVIMPKNWEAPETASGQEAPAMEETIKSIAYYVKAYALMEKLVGERGEQTALTILLVALMAGALKWGIDRGETYENLGDTLICHVSDTFKAVYDQANQTVQ